MPKRPNRHLLLRASSANEATMTVEAVVATESIVPVFDGRTFEEIDEILLIAGFQQPRGGQVPLLDSHDRSTIDSLVGSVTGFTPDGPKLRAVLTIAEDEQDAWTKVRAGHLTDVSVGYRIQKSVELRPGETRTIAGRSFTAAGRTLRIALEWTVRECSLVAIGADDLAKIRSDTGSPGSPAPPDHHRTVNAGGRTMPGRQHNWDSPQTREESIAILEMGMRIASGLPVVDAGASPARQEYLERLASQAAGNAGVRLPDVARQCVAIEHNRGDEPIGISELESVDLALRTATFSRILTSTVGANMMRGFEEIHDSTTGWTEERDVRNFQTQERYGVGQVDQLNVLPPGAHAEEGEVLTTKETYRAHRFSRSMKIDAQQILDDDLGALVDVPRRLGAAAHSTKLDLIYAVLMENAALVDDNVAVFHADHSNLAANALGQANLETGISAVSKQTFNSRPLNLRAKHLIVPSALSVTAKKLMRDIYQPRDPDQLTVHSDSRLDAAGVINPVDKSATAGTSTGWYLAAPGWIEVGFVRGRRTPDLREFMLDRGEFGMGFTLVYDFGVKILGYHGLYKGNT